MYKIQKYTMYGEVRNTIIRLNENGTQTSFGEWLDNTDYQQYLKWLEAGNTPLPPDTQPE